MNLDNFVREVSKEKNKQRVIGFDAILEVRYKNKNKYLNVMRPLSEQSKRSDLRNKLVSQLTQML